MLFFISFNFEEISKLVVLLHLRSHVSTIAFKIVDKLDELTFEGVKFLISLFVNLIHLLLV